MKKYQKGGPAKKPSMNPAKIAVGPVKPATPKQKEEALKKFKDAMKKEIEKAPFPAAPKKQMGGTAAENPLNKRYQKFRGNTSDNSLSAARIGDKSINFKTFDAGKTYTKDVLKRVSPERKARIVKRNPDADTFYDDRILRSNTMSKSKALRQANRLAKRTENQPVSPINPATGGMKKGGTIKKKK